MGEFESRSFKHRDTVKGFYLPENSQKLCEFDSTRRKIYEVRLYSLISFHDTVNSQNLETAKYIAHVIFMLNSVMKTHLTNKKAMDVN